MGQWPLILKVMRVVDPETQTSSWINSIGRPPGLGWSRLASCIFPIDWSNGIWKFATWIGGRECCCGHNLVRVAAVAQKETPALETISNEVLDGRTYLARLGNWTARVHPFWIPFGWNL